MKRTEALQLTTEAWQVSESAPAQHECHEAKSVLNYSPFPEAIYEILHDPQQVVYEIKYNEENRFLSPDLEPRRKPPKFV